MATEDISSLQLLVGNSIYTRLAPLGTDCCRCFCTGIVHCKVKRRTHHDGRAGPVCDHHRRGSGIGRALAVALASRGVHVTILDVSTDQGEETVRLVKEEHGKISYKPSSPSAIFIRCDVSKSDELAAAFARHQEVFGRLHICINNAGVLTSAAPFYEHEEAWRKVIDVNLVAVINGTCRAIQAMKDHGGLVLNISSAYGFVPNLFDPMYATSKAGVAMLTRSLATIGMGIRVNALCPEYVNTPLLSDVPSSLTDFLRDRVGFVELEKVIAAAFALLDDDSKVGECLWVPANRPTEVWPDEESKSKHQIFMKDGSICFDPFAQMS